MFYVVAVNSSRAHNDTLMVQNIGIIFREHPVSDTKIRNLHP